MGLFSKGTQQPKPKRTINGQLPRGEDFVLHINLTSPRCGRGHKNCTVKGH